MNETTVLFPAKKDGKSGYINAKGQIVIDFVFDFHGSREFSEGLASVFVNGKAGYIDFNGNFVIQTQFELAMPFSEGRAYVGLNGKLGYINKSGEFIVKPQYYSCDSFSEGFALVKDTETSDSYFIDKNGQTKLNSRNFLLSELREGLINCPDEHGNWGFIDIDDNIVIDFQHKFTRPFFEGKGAVAPKKDKDGKSNRKDKYGFVNSENELLIEPNFQGADIRFSEGLCVVWDEGYGCIDTKGHLVIPYEFELIKHFKEDLAVFNPKGRNEKFGVIGKNGMVKIEPKYSHLEDFKNGLSEIIIGTDYESFKYGYINKNGDEVWEPRR